MLRFTLALFCLLAATAASSATYYVAPPPSGNDANPGSEALPWASLQRAAAELEPGDTVYVRDGTYAGGHFTRSGTAEQPIVLAAFPGETPVINANNPVTIDGINLEGASHMVVEGFTVIGTGRAGIRAVLCEQVVIRRNRTDLNTRWGIFTGFCDDLLIEHNETSRSAVEHGIYVSNSGDRPVIRNNLIWGNNANGIHMNGDRFQGGDGIISDALVENNIIFDNGGAGGSGINCDGVQDSLIRNNLIYHSHASGISLYTIDGGGPSSGNRVLNNTVLTSASGRWALNIRDGAVNTTVRNNILRSDHPGFRGSLSISADSLAGFTSNHNAVMDRFSTDGGNSNMTLAAWRVALVTQVSGYSGAILSPLNADSARMSSLVDKLPADEFRFVFDPQLYFPRTERDRLRAWHYFPNDVEAADLADLEWWIALSKRILDVCKELGVDVTCSPAIVPSTFDTSFYRMATDLANRIVTESDDIEVLQTLIVDLPSLSSRHRVMEIASIASATAANGLYIIFLVNKAPRSEIDESRWLAGGMRLIHELSAAGISTVVGFCGPEAILYTAAGASICASGKFFNLRRFTPGRFDEPTEGGGQLPYWFEESLLAYLREADLLRVRANGLLSAASLANPFGRDILERLDHEPGRPWLALSWQHYMHWFADVDERLRSGMATVDELLLAAERTWEELDNIGLLMEERRNDGRWVRPWRIALREYLQAW